MRRSLIVTALLSFLLAGFFLSQSPDYRETEVEEVFLHPEDYRDSKIVLEGEWVSDNRSSERPALLMDSEGHSVEVFCKDKYTSRVSSGDRVRVYGVMKTEGDPEDLMAADGWIECRQTLELLERR